MEGNHELIPAYFAFKHLTKNNSGELVGISEKKTPANWRMSKTVDITTITLRELRNLTCFFKSGSADLNLNTSNIIGFRHQYTFIWFKKIEFSSGKILNPYLILL